MPSNFSFPKLWIRFTCLKYYGGRAIIAELFNDLRPLFIFNYTLHVNYFPMFIVQKNRDGLKYE